MPPITRSAYKSRNKARESQKIVFEGCCRLDGDCCICLSSIFGESVYHTPCAHTYHTGCLRNQVELMRGTNKMACAMCRGDLREQIMSQPNLRSHSVSDSVSDSDTNDELNINIIEIMWVPNMYMNNRQRQLANVYRGILNSTLSLTDEIITTNNDVTNENDEDAEAEEFVNSLFVEDEMDVEESDDSMPTFEYE